MQDRPRKSWEMSSDDEMDQSAVPTWDQSGKNELTHDDPEKLSPAEKAGQFSDMLVSLKRRGRLNAKEVCILSYWAVGAGNALQEGTAGDIAFPPYKQKYSRHLDNILHPKGLNDGLMPLSVPLYSKFDGSRRALPYYALPGHEALADELRDEPDLHHKLAQAHIDHKLPPVYYNHPVVREHGLGTFPIAIYLDKVEFAKRDGTLGMTVTNMISGRRHLVLGLRKTELCRCGCRGYCSLFVAFVFIRWFVEAAASGLYPSFRHDMSDFLQSERFRSALAGQTIGAHFAVCMLRGDWGEFGPTLQFPTFHHLYHPCPLCKSPKEGLNDISGFTSLAMPYMPKKYADFDAACKAAEHIVTLTAESHRKIRAVLAYDRTNKVTSLRGRHLVADVTAPGVALLAGDRLEPSMSLQDIGDQFDNLRTFPFTVCFWRRSAESMVYHRNPMWSEAIGLTHDKVMGVDWLHTLCLGVFHSFLLHVMHLLFDKDAWDTRESTAEARIAMSVDRISHELIAFYHARKAQGVNVTEIVGMDKNSFGKASSPSCSFKAAESNHFMPYLSQLIDRFAHLLPDPAGHGQACRCLLRCVELIHQYPDVFPEAACQDIQPAGL